MVLAVVLAALLLCFVFFKRHIGIAFLAMVAGLAVYDHFGALFAETIRTWVPAVDVTLTQQILYALFVAVIPLLLYFRAGKSGLFGLLRIAEAVVFAATLTVLLSDLLVYYFSFDTLAAEITQWLDGAHGYMMVAGVILAYVDIFFYRSV